MELDSKDNKFNNIVSNNEKRKVSLILLIYIFYPKSIKKSNSHLPGAEKQVERHCDGCISGAICLRDRLRL